MEDNLIWQNFDEVNINSNALQSLRISFTKTSKDMSETKFDAWVYGIIVGWDDSSYDELSVLHNWTPSQIACNKQLHENYNKAWKLFINDISE